MEKLTRVKILIYGNPDSEFNREAVVIAQRFGYQVFWVAARRLNILGVKDYCLPDKFNRSVFWRALLEPFLVIHAIRSSKTDIVQVQYAAKYLSVLPLSFFHPLLVVTMGGDVMPDQDYHGIGAWFIRWLLDHADLITSRSDSMDGAIMAIGKYKEKVRRITRGVRMDVYRPDRDVLYLRDTYHIQPWELVFFDSRAAKPFYNKHIILQAFARYINNTGYSAVLLVTEAYADEAYDLSLKQMAVDLGIVDQVRFLGMLDRAQLPDLYALADVVISIPPSDGLPQTIYEAMASGAFLIVGDIPQYKGLVQDEITAKLVPVGDVKALAVAMTWVGEHSEIREKAVALSRAYIKQFADYEGQVELMRKVYEELLSKTNKPLSTRHSSLDERM